MALLAREPCLAWRESVQALEQTQQRADVLVVGAQSGLQHDFAGGELSWDGRLRFGLSRPCRRRRQPAHASLLPSVQEDDENGAESMLCLMLYATCCTSHGQGKGWRAVRRRQGVC